MLPDVADQYQVMLYVYVATFAAYTWDWLMSIPEEYTFVRKAGFNAPNAAYFLSRFGTFCSCLTNTIRIAPIDNCNALKYVEGVFIEIAIPATSLLFLFRVKAIYNHSKIITAFFGFLWIAIAGLSILIMLGITRDHIPYTRRCTEGLAHTYTMVPIILTAVYDTLIFIAISYRMISLSMLDGPWSARVKSFFTGKGLHYLSRAMLQSGQAYYFITIGVAIASTALILAPSVPSEIKPILGSTYFALASSMACRVFRALLLGTIKDPHMNVARPAAINPKNSADSGTTSKRDKTCLSSLVINVEVEMDTRADSYDGHTCWDGQSSKGDDKRHDPSDQV